MKVPNHILFAEVEQQISQGKNVKIPLVGNSMYPFLRENRHILTLSPVQSFPLKVGTIALFRHNGQHVLHRLIRRNKKQYTFSGDGNINVFEHVKESDVVAVLTGVEVASGKSVNLHSPIRHCIVWLWLRCPKRRLLLRFCRRVLKI